MNTFPYTRYDYSAGASTYSPIGFSFRDPSQVKVILADGNGTPRTLEYGIDFTVSGDSVIIASGKDWGIEPEKVFILRDTSSIDSPTFTNGVYLDVKKVQYALEAMNAQISELKVVTDNSVKFSLQEWHEVNESDPFTIPPKGKRAGRILAFDDDGNALMILTTDIEQKLDQALAAENAAIEAKDLAVGARDDALNAQEGAETARREAERAEASANALLSSIDSKTQASIESVESKRDSSLAAVQTEADASLARIEEEKSNAVTAIGNAKTTSVDAIETQRESIVNEAKQQMTQAKEVAVQNVASAGSSALRDISEHRTAALSDISSAGSSASASVSSAESSALGSIESLTNEKLVGIETLTTESRQGISSTADTVKASVAEEGDAQVERIKGESDSQIEAIREVYQSDITSLTSALNETQKELEAQKVINKEQTYRLENLEAEAEGAISKTWEETTSNGVLNFSASSPLAPNAMVEEFEGESRTTKNLLNPTLGTTTQNGITCTNNGDGTYTVNGTATGGSAQFILSDTLITSLYSKALGCPTGGSNTTYRIDYRKTDGSWGVDAGDGHISSIGFNYAKIVIYNGVTVSNLVFKPMITTDTTATYSSYEPYFDGIKHSLVRGVESFDENGTSLGQLLLPTPIELKGVGSVRDSFTASKDGNYTLTQNVCSLDLKGSAVSYRGESESTLLVSINLATIPTSTIVLCDKYTYSSPTSVWTNKNVGCYADSNHSWFVLCVQKSDFSSAMALQTWLASNSMNICYSSNPDVTIFDKTQIGEPFFPVKAGGSVHALSDEAQAEAKIKYKALLGDRT